MPKLTSSKCPKRETLSRFVLGKLDPIALSQCESHLSQCQPCVETISGLDISDTFQSLVVDSVGEPDSLSEGDESVVGNLIHRMIDIGSKTSARKSLDQRAADIVGLLDPATSDDAIGQIEHYRIEEILGCGSTGVVFKAIDENLGRPVAIKVLRPSLGDAARQRFIAEARATANLDHANVVTIFHVGDAGSLAFIVMQWLPGETLDQRLQRKSILSAEAVQDFGNQIADGLAAAHRKGLVHRDIKPANLWITESNRVKILDFGLVRIMDENPQLTCTGMIAGTPCYMSPEQSRGDELDARSDLFSLGCVLYQCLTGKLPFASSNALATLQAIQQVQPASPRSLDASTPADVSDLVMGLLEKSPHRRPDSASDVASALTSDRSAWPFECDDYSIAKVQAERKPLKSATVRTSSSSFWKYVAMTLAAGAIGLGGFMFGPQIIRIAMNEGEIVINSNDPDVSVEVLQGGETIKVVDLKTKQSIQIKSGSYQIRPVGDENSISIDKETLTLSRGESAIVTVTKTESASENTITSAGSAGDTSAKPKIIEQFPNQQLPAATSTTATASGTLVAPDHRVGPGDVLAVFIESVLGNLQEKNTGDYLGRPVPVRGDGSISLPEIEPLQVSGMTALEIENKIREKYVGPIIKYGYISVVVKKAFAGNVEPKLTEPVYDGLTLAQCINAIEFERDGQKLEKPIYGIIELTDLKTADFKLINQLVKAVMRVDNRDAVRVLARNLSDEQLQKLAIEITSSDSTMEWYFVQKVVRDWDRIKSVEDQLVTNIIEVINGEEKTSEVASNVLLQILLKEAVSTETKNRSFEPLLKSLPGSTNAHNDLYHLALTYPAMEGLGDSIATAISKSDRGYIDSWRRTLSMLNSENQKSSIEAFTKKVLSDPTFANGIPIVVTEYFCEMPDSIFQIVEPELKTQSNSGNSTAMRIISSRFSAAKARSQ